MKTTTHYRQTRLRMGDIAAINDELQYNGIVPVGYIPDMRKIRIRAERKAPVK